tara:strand:+ start:3548 stop:3886 length:339 start_codon:yes stop_codon:yes gene_type:complete
MNKRRGRPDDKSNYIESFINSMNYGSTDNSELKSALNKLNAKEIVLLNCYMAKSNDKSLASVIDGLPFETPAQMNRTQKAIEFFKKLEADNVNTNTSTSTESQEFTVEKAYS